MASIWHFQVILSGDLQSRGALYLKQEDDTGLEHYTAESRIFIPRPSPITTTMPNASTTASSIYKGTFGHHSYYLHTFRDLLINIDTLVPPNGLGWEAFVQGEVT